jgi:hypothetical protein
MTVIRCTSKLLKLMARSPVTNRMEPAADDWYANLLWLDGRKCLLIAHAATLFSVFEPDVTKASLTHFGPWLLRLIERELAAEDMSPTTFGPLQASSVMIGRTCNRSVLGSMTDMRYQIERAVQQSGGLTPLDLPGLNRSLRRIPFSAIKYDRPIDRARALFGGTEDKTPAATPLPAQATGDRIEDLFASFLAARRARLAPREFRNYQAIIDLFRRSLNSYAYESLSPLDRKRWERAFNSGDEDAYSKLFGADKIPGEVGAFVGYFMIRKVAAPKTIIASTGRVITDLLDWLVEQDLLRLTDIVDAKERAHDAGSDLPKAEKLASLLDDLAERSNVDVHGLADEDYIEDYLTITRVEPGELWFAGVGGEIGPLEVGRAISRIASPGWSVNVVMGRVRGRWQVVEVGNVYPN